MAQVTLDIDQLLFEVMKSPAATQSILQLLRKMPADARRDLVHAINREFPLVDWNAMRREPAGRTVTCDRSEVEIRDGIAYLLEWTHCPAILSIERKPGDLFTYEVDCAYCENVERADNGGPELHSVLAKIIMPLGTPMKPLMDHFQEGGQVVVALKALEGEGFIKGIFSSVDTRCGTIWIRSLGECKLPPQEPAEQDGPRPDAVATTEEVNQ